MAWGRAMQSEWQLPGGVTRRLAVAAAFVVVAALGYWWLSAPVDATPVAAVVVRDEPTETRIIVDVVGDVRHPGVVRLPLGSRVLDAVAAAGGVKSGHRPVINMARKLVDGEQIVVGSGMQTVAGSSAAAGRVSINSASAAQLEQLPGVGPVTAQRIVDYRTAHGPFSQLRDLLNVPGIGDAKYAQIADAATL